MKYISKERKIHSTGVRLPLKSHHPPAWRYKGNGKKMFFGNQTSPLDNTAVSKTANTFFSDCRINYLRGKKSLITWLSRSHVTTLISNPSVATRCQCSTGTWYSLEVSSSLSQLPSQTLWLYGPVQCFTLGFQCKALLGITVILSFPNNYQEVAYGKCMQWAKGSQPGPHIWFKVSCVTNTETSLLDCRDHLHASIVCSSQEDPCLCRTPTYQSL